MFLFLITAIERPGILLACILQLANHSSDNAIQYLCNEINATNTVFPGTELQLIYKLGSS